MRKINIMKKIYVLVSLVLFLLSVNIKQCYGMEEKIDITKYDTKDSVHHAVFNGIEWYIFEDGLLYLTGEATGTLADEYGLVPYENFRTQITKIYCDYNPGKYSVDNLFNGMTKVYYIEFGTSFITDKVPDMYAMFYDCKALKELDMSRIDTSRVTDMSFMFYNCDSLEKLDVSGFNTKRVADMSFMFYNCEKLGTIDVSHWNTSSVKDMNHMFYSCKAVKTLAVQGFDTKNVKDMNGMFGFCEHVERIDARHFDTKKVKNMEQMFNFCSSLEAVNLESFDTKGVENVSDMFKGCFVLGLLNTPGRTGDKAIVLPVTMYDTDGQGYDEIETDETGSQTLRIEGYIGKDFKLETKAEKRNKKILSDILNGDKEYVEREKKRVEESTPIGKAKHKGYAGADDTAAIQKDGKKYVLRLDDEKDENTITLLKGSRIYLDMTDIDEESIVTFDKSRVKVSENGLIYAKKSTDGEKVLIEYMLYDELKKLYVRVMEPKASERVIGYDAKPLFTWGMNQVIEYKKVSESRFVSATYEVPLNAEVVKLTGKDSNFIAEVSADDGLLHISGIVSKKGTYKVILKVNQRRMTARLIII